METNKIWALAAVSLLVASGVCAQESTDGASQPVPHPGVDGSGAQGPLTDEQRQARETDSKAVTDKERAATQARGAEQRRPGGFTEEERQAMRERRESMSEEERAVARERTTQQRGGEFPGSGQFPGGGQTGGIFPGGGQTGGVFPGGGQTGGAFPGGGQTGGQFPGGSRPQEGDPRSGMGR